MALSDKHEGKTLVPWFNCEEWNYVYHLLYSKESTDYTKKQALEILKIWKSRTSLLSSGIEGTLIILSALCTDENCMTEEQLCLLYATSVMRFLNLCAANSKKQGTFYETARKHNLPDWLIDIRHDLAHDQRIPSKFMLKFSLTYCLDWLKREYWDVQGQLATDFINESDQQETVDVSPYIRNYCDIVNDAVHNLAQVVSDLSKDRIEELGVLLRSKLINENSTIHQVLLLLCNMSLRNISKGRKEALAAGIAKTIIDDGGIFIVPEESSTQYLEYCSLWETIIVQLNKQDMLLPLIKLLLPKKVDDDDSLNIKGTCSMWLARIFKGFYSHQTENSTDKNDKTNFDKVGDDVTKHLQDLKSYVLANPNEFTLKYLRPLLGLSGCPEGYIEKVEKIVKSYTLVKNENMLCDDLLHTAEEVIESYGGINEMKSIEKETEVQPTHRRWQLVQDTSAFKGCPLGVLPHQSRARNPLLNYA